MDPQNIFAIGDIHGQYQALLQLIQQINNRRAPGDLLIFLGDYIDRGPNSKEVVELLMQMEMDNPDVVAIKGNHDWWPFAPWAMAQHEWRKNYARPTLLSYGAIIENGSLKGGDFPHDHGLWLQMRPLTYKVGNLFFSHSGGNPNKPFEDQDEWDWLWERDDFPADRRWPYHMVFGHSAHWRPNAVGRLKISHSARHTNLDTGAGHGKALTCGRFTLVGATYELSEVMSVDIETGELLVY